MNEYEMELERIFKHNCTNENAKDAVYLTLKHSIIHRIIPIGTILNSSHLAKIFYLSRTPVESALTKLAYEKLILSTPQNGYLTYTYSFKEVRDSNEFMLGLYLITNTLAHKKVDYYYYNMLSQKLAELEGIDDCLTYLYEGNLFHLLLAESTGNQHLITCLQHENDKSSLITLKDALNDHTEEFMVEHKQLDRQLLEVITKGTYEDVLAESARHNDHMRHFIFKYSIPI